MEATPLPPNMPAWQDGRYETGDDGRFEIACLVPGVEYRIRAFNRESMNPGLNRSPAASGPLEKVIVVKEGQSLDLGDVHLAEEAKFGAQASGKQSESTPSAAGAARSGGNTQAVAALAAEKPAGGRQAKPATKAATKASGRVVAPDGKPVSGAKVYLIKWSLRGEQPAPQLIGTTDEKGAFEFTLPATNTANETIDRMKSHHIAVVASGYGMVYITPHELWPQQGALGAIASALTGATSAATIDLPTEAPLKGRVVTVDGRPVAKARVTLRRISSGKPQGNPASRRDLEARGRAEKEINWRLRLDELTHFFFPAQLSTVAPTATTGADGWFELRGIGADRLVQLLIEGDGIESRLLNARTIPGETITVKPAPGFGDDPDKLYGPGFVHVVGPSKPIEGRVLDLDTKEPISGAVVRTYAVQGERLNSSRDRQHFATVTDKEGRYRITGLPVGKGNSLVAFTMNDTPYVPIGHDINTEVAGAAVQQDFRMKKGVWVEGRAYDTTTNKPLAGQLEYFIVRNPELERAIPGLRDAFLDEHYFTDAEGRFRIPVLATRGILAFRYVPASGGNMNTYPRGMGAEKISGAKQLGKLAMFETIPSYLIPENYSAVVEVSPKAGDKTAAIDFPISSGRKLLVDVVDDNGRPVTVGLEFSGHDDSSGWRHNDGPACEVLALEPGRSRNLFFYCRGATWLAQ